jgi:DNA-directed RNA polymerase specialized sigma24 family protein
MRNLFLDECRMQRARVTVPADGDLPAAAPDQRPHSPSDLLDTEDVLEAMSKMPARHRTVLMLAHFSGASYRDIAARLGMPPRTVGTRLFRARRRLRGILAQIFQARLHALDAEGGSEAVPSFSAKQSSARSSLNNHHNGLPRK